MIPNWIVYIGMDGKIYAYEEFGPLPTRDILKTIGVVSAYKKEDAINYIVATGGYKWEK